MNSISSGVVDPIVVSHTTTRFEAPIPVTYAFGTVTFSLAFIRNIRSGGISIPPRATTFSSLATRAGFDCSSGSNLLNSGSTHTGYTNTPKTVAAIAGIQNQNHHRRGDLPITQKNNITSNPPTAQ